MASIPQTDDIDKRFELALVQFPREEKEIKKVYKRQRRRRSKSSSSSLPLDLTSEILLRLPEKSVVRFRGVSKLWSSITADPYFINLFKARSPRLLLCVHAKNKMFVSSISQHHHSFDTWNKSYSSSQPIDRYHMEFPKYDPFHPIQSVQGLICFRVSARPIVWNPCTRRLITLPKPNISSNELEFFLGYDPVENKHKVMCIPNNLSSKECRVLTLGSAQESWRRVKINLDLGSPLYFSGRCINGVVYYLSLLHLTDVKGFIASFDVRSEKFDKIQLPPSSGVRTNLVAYQGRLACVDRNPNMKNGIRLWILEDAEKHKWSSKDFLAPFDHHDDKSLGTCSRLKGFTHTGELVYVDYKFSKLSCILFCDPVRNSYRRFELKGITDDESLLSNLRRDMFNVVLNHFDSRVSL